MKNISVEQVVANLGKQIRYYRKLHGMTQEELAERVGIKSGARISDYERGQYKIGLEILLRFATAFDISLAQLFCFEEQPPASNTKAENLIQARLDKTEKLLKESLKYERQAISEIKKLKKKRL